MTCTYNNRDLERNFTQYISFISPFQSPRTFIHLTICPQRKSQQFQRNDVIEITWGRGVYFLFLFLSPECTEVRHQWWEYILPFHIFDNKKISILKNLWIKKETKMKMKKKFRNGTQRKHAHENI